MQSRVQKIYLFVPYRLLQVTTLREYEYGYSAVHGFWPVEETAELAAGPTGCGDLARGGCSFACNFNATRSTVFTEAERRTRPNRRCRCINPYRTNVENRVSS